MRPRAMLAVLVMVVCPMTSLPAQTHLSVEIQDPVYQLLETAQLKGALETLSAVRPYSRSQVIALLDRLWEASDKLSEAERAVLKRPGSASGRSGTVFATAISLTSRLT